MPATKKAKLDINLIPSSLPIPRPRNKAAQKKPEERREEPEDEHDDPQTALIIRICGVTSPSKKKALGDFRNDLISKTDEDSDVVSREAWEFGTSVLYAQNLAISSHLSHMDSRLDSLDENL